QLLLHGLPLAVDAPQAEAAAEDDDGAEHAQRPLEPAEGGDGALAALEVVPALLAERVDALLDRVDLLVEAGDGGGVGSEDLVHADLPVPEYLVFELLQAFLDSFQRTYPRGGCRRR